MFLSGTSMGVSESSFILVEIKTTDATKRGEDTVSRTTVAGRSAPGVAGQNKQIQMLEQVKRNSVKHNALIMSNNQKLIEDLGTLGFDYEQLKADQK